MTSRRDFNSAFLALAASAALPAGLSACATAGASRGISGVDTHAHVFHRGMAFVPDRRYTPDYDAFPEQYLAMLAQNGMSHGVIIPISIVGTDNTYTVQVLRQHRERLRGLAVVDPEKDLDKLDALAAAGIIGIRLNLIGKPAPNLAAAPWAGLIAACVRLDWQVEVYDDARRLAETVKPLIAAGAKVVIDHFGKPDPKQGIDDPGFRFLLSVAPSRQVWVKLSAPYRSSNAVAAAAAPLLRKAFGPERLIWGSDWPHTGFEGKVKTTEMRALLDQWIPDNDERRVILTETPAKLFKF